MKDGVIEVDSIRGKIIGFTSDKFAKWSYLWRRGDYILISLIVCHHPGRKDLSGLFARIEELGFGINVPNPLAMMRAIVVAKGFKKTYEVGPEGRCECWVRPPPGKLPSGMSAVAAATDGHPRTGVTSQEEEN